MLTDIVIVIVIVTAVLPAASHFQQSSLTNNEWYAPTRPLRLRFHDKSTIDSTRLNMVIEQLFERLAALFVKKECLKIHGYTYHVACLIAVTCFHVLLKRRFDPVLDLGLGLNRRLR